MLTFLVFLLFCEFCKGTFLLFAIRNVVCIKAHLSLFAATLMSHKSEGGREILPSSVRTRLIHALITLTPSNLNVPCGKTIKMWKAALVSRSVVGFFEDKHVIDRAYCEKTGCEN